MNILKSKRFRYGTFSTAMMLFAVVLFVLVNLLADGLNRSFDLTAEQIFSLREESREFLSTLDMDVTITYVIPPGQENSIIVQLMAEYAAASSHISTEIRDPMMNPILLSQLAEEAGVPNIVTGSIIVQSAAATRVVHPNHMVMFVYNQQGEAVGIRSFNFETEMTRAIHSVSQGTAPVVYFVTGSGEDALHPALISTLESENFIVREVNLLAQDVPETADILFIPMPTRDWGELKADRILAFLENQGRAFFAMHPHPLMERFEQVDRVLSAYGVAMGNGWIFEVDTDSHIGIPLHVIPHVTHHPIVNSLFEQDFMNYMHFPTYIRTLDIVRTSVTIEPLFVTSRIAFARTSNETVFEQRPNDTSGPFSMAVAITDHRFVAGNNIISRLVVASSDSILDNYFNTRIGGGNYHFIVNSLRWMSDRPQGIFIPSRAVPGNIPLVITAFQENVMMGIAVGAIPAVSLSIGIFIWFKRRHS